MVERICLSDRMNIRLSQPADLITLIYQIVIMLTILFHMPAVSNSGILLLYHTLIIAFVLWLPYSGESSLMRWLRVWSPVVIIPTNFAELHHLVHSISPIDLDSALIHFDLQLFGVHPTVWLEQWSYPWLTEYFQWIYTTFYFLPILLAVILRRKHEFEKFHLFVFAIVVGFYASYLGYFLVPAIGPRFTLDHLQTTPLTGIWITQEIRQALNYLENIQRDAFPSGHTEITLLTMIYARRFARRYYHVLLVIGTSLIISTVYLRYHYVIDVFAGIILAVIVYYLVPMLYRLISSKFKFVLMSNTEQP